LLIGLLLGAFCLPASAHAAFPGANGKIAYCGPNGEWAINPDGSGAARILTGLPSNETGCAANWSPDGQRLAFRCVGGQGICRSNPDGSGFSERYEDVADGSYVSSPHWSPDGASIVFDDNRFLSCDPNGEECFYEQDVIVVDADAPAPHFRNVTNSSSVSEWNPAWAPDGSKVAYQRNSGIWTMNPSGTEQQLVIPGGAEPDWSPDSSKLVYVKHLAANWELFSARRDGSGETQLTTTATDERHPVWAPDGTKVAFDTEDGYPSYASSLVVMNPDGTDRRVLASGVFGPPKSDTSVTYPSWQALPVDTPSTYARPKGATPSYLSLVPAYQQCTAPNRTHGAPLGFPSCNPPMLNSPRLTIGTPDANGKTARSIGTVQLYVQAGVPGGPDDSDVAITVSTKDVYNASDLSDYAGELQARLGVSLTDKQAGVSSTTLDFPVSFAVSCTANSDPSTGSACAINTTADAVQPGLVPEGQRSIWALDRAEVYDGGADGQAATTGDNTLFMDQGVFIP
jgi:TolB protein